ncbi:MAG: P27 family phage terminase small subunit [Pseudomonadota bacterium]
MEKFPFKCPAGVPKEVRKQFNYFEKLLAPRGNWTEGDIDGIMALCESKVAVAKLRKEVDEEGRTYWATTGQGNRVMKTNPACALLDKEIRRFDNYLYEYGLTPLGRIKLGISPDGGGPLDEIEDKDDAAKYF